MKTNKTVLITAGPTREALDPVRYISNHSSGKMGYAIAQEFLRRDYKVILVSGPVQVTIDAHPFLTLIKTESAIDMLNACEQYFSTTDICIFAAAVADYRPAEPASQKIKKKSDTLIIELVKNPDIASCFGKVKTTQQLSIGFALETNDEMEHAKQKMHSKNLDLVVLNSMNDKQATFGFDTNKISILDRSGEVFLFPLKSKKEVAGDIADATEALLPFGV